MLAELTGTGRRSGTLAPVELPPNAQLLDDILTRTCALSVRGDEAEESWRVVTPILDTWSNELAPLQEYAAGSDGPPQLPS
jgi:glucose-6-phosphate 1-dehydrogenase